EKLRFFVNYDLMYHKRYRAGAAMFERYLKFKGADVATALTLASCSTEIEKDNEAEALLTKVLARPKTDENAAGDYARQLLSNIQAKIYSRRRQHHRWQRAFSA